MRAPRSGLLLGPSDRVFLFLTLRRFTQSSAKTRRKKTSTYRKEKLTCVVYRLEWLLGKLSYLFCVHLFASLGEMTAKKTDDHGHP